MSILESFIKHDTVVLDTLKEIYTKNVPFKHLYLDSFFSEEDINGILSEWPSLQDTRWDSLKRMVDYGVGSKLEISKLELMGHKTQEVLRKVLSPEFIQSLEYVTEIQNLKSDTDLYGGGLIYTPTGGFLKVHADFNYYDKIKMYRRINLIIYLNEEWKDEWNGNIEFWSEEMLKVKSYPPKLNTCMMFHVNDKAFHGYPDILKCPNNIGRKSINLYFYTELNDEMQDKTPHKTIWKESSNTSVNLTTY